MTNVHATKIYTSNKKN